MQNMAGISCKSCTSELYTIRKTVKEACQAFGLTQARSNEVVLAIDEACANVIRHTCSFSDKFHIEVSFKEENGYGVFLIKDDCPPISEQCLRPKDAEPLKPGGLGLHLIHHVMDSVALLPHPGKGNWLELKLKL